MMRRSLLRDERGFYFVIFLLVLILFLLPLMGIVIGIGQIMVARSEAQIITDAIALDIANHSPKETQLFTYNNSCGDVEYIGKEPYLNYVGDAAARDIANNRFGLNALRTLKSLEVTSITIEDPYVPASDTAQVIPDFIRQGSHDPMVTVTTKSTYSMIFRQLWGSQMAVTRIGASRKSYKGTAVNIDRYEAHPAHPPCPRPPVSSGDGSSGSTGSGDSDGFDVDTGG